MERTFVDTSVSYGQLLVVGAAEHADLELFVAADALVSQSGASTVTVLAGLHTGTVRVRVAEVAAAPKPDEGWDAESEATIWSPEGRVAVIGLMSGPPDGLDDVVTAGPGLYRVRVRARHRRREGPGYDDLPPEEFELLLWQVDEDPGIATLRTDALGPMRQPDPAAAAAWAGRRLAVEADPPPEQRNLRTMGGTRPLHGDGPVQRATVRRRHPVPPDAGTAALSDPARWLGAEPDGGDLVVSLGPLAIRLRAGSPAAAPRRVGWGWRWAAAPASTAEPADTAESTVELELAGSDGATYLSLRHGGVRAADAVPVGLIWDHLLERAASPPAADPGPPAWVATFEAEARQARERAEALRLRVEAAERAAWGGRLPSDRLRTAGNVLGLRQVDPDLVHALDGIDDGRLREVARWAARRGLAVAGLDAVGWVTELLAVVERGEQPPFGDTSPIWERLWADPDVPRTLVTSPGGAPNASQQAMALPALFGAAEADALHAAVAALYAAAIAHGDARPAFLAALRAEFPELVTSSRR